MMDIFTTKESALIHLNSTRIAAGEIKVYRYYSSNGSIDSFVVIGLQDGIGPDCYQILSKRKNLIVNIDTEMPDSSRLIQGQIHVFPVNGIYHMIYLEDTQRVDKEISDSEVYYVEDFDSGYMYYLDRYTCKKLDDYFSKVYIDLSNTNALYEPGKYPETAITVWKDNSDVTEACRIGITTTGCSAIFDGSKIIRVTSMPEKTAKVVIKVIYRGNTYQETWNIQKVQEGIKGADAEVWSVISRSSFIREPDMQSTTFQVLYQSGSEISNLDVSDLQNYGLCLTYEYSNGVVGQIDTQEFEFEPRDSYDTEITYCIVRLQKDSEVLSAITLPYLLSSDSIESGQGVYKALVFCRSNNTPETPLGGSWDSPIPTTGQWTQDVPSGAEVLWTSTRIFTTDARTPQDASWSTPSRISNTDSLEVMYSTCQDSTIVGTPSTKSENWESVVTGIAYFMATRTITNGVPGLWQIFAIHGVDGSPSDYKNYIYCNSITKPETPAGSHPEGWADFPDVDGIWWMCVGLFSGRTNELIGTWSNPVKISGIDGDPGLDAPYLIYQYAIGTSPTDAPTYNWSGSIPTVPKGMYLWQRSGTVVPPNVAPSAWNVPVRVTGERGETGAPGTAITIDLTNEVSSVAADYEGNVIDSWTFETTQVLLYNNGIPVNLENDEDVRSMSIVSDGVRASISKSGLVTIHNWTAPKEKDIATVVVSVNYKYNTYTAVYSIQKIKSGSPGKDAVLYSIITNTNVLRKVNSVISPDKLTAQVRKAVGASLSNITNLEAEGLELVYTTNGSSTEITYDPAKGINTAGIEYITLTLKSKSTGSVIDKETVLTIEGTLDLIVDLTNEVSAIAADEGGQIKDTTNFEESTVCVFYGSKRVDPGDCRIKASWTNLIGDFNSLTGTITPTGWDPNKLSESTGQCTLEVTYREFTKTVTYTVTKIDSGETPTLWSIVPSVTGIKATNVSVSDELITVKVYKIYGTDRSEIEPANFKSEGIKLRYARTFEDTGLEAEKAYETHIPVTVRTNKVEITLYNQSDDVLDRESVYVVHDGSPGARPDWKDYIFCKKDTQPNPPTFTKHPVSGSADNYGQVWHNGPTSGSVDEIWWMSTATIDGQSDDDSLLRGTSWSTPVRVTGYDGTGYECQYTNSKNLVTPPESSNWTNTPTAPPYGYYTWMRMRSTKDPDWKYMRITGERGSDGNSIIVKGDLTYVGNDANRIQTSTVYEMLLIGATPYTDGLESYVGNIYQGQELVAGSRIANGDTYLYSGRFFVCTGTSGAMNTWQVVNVQGDPGESWMTYIAFASNKKGTDKVQTWEPGLGLTYMGVAVVNTSEYSNWGDVPADAYEWAEFHGQEGIGNEFIFARNDSSIIAPELDETKVVNDKNRSNDDYLPEGWTDDPQPVEDVDGHRVQWVSTRQKTGGVWGSFKTPVVWNRFAKDGTSIVIKGVLQYVGRDNNNYSNYIICTSEYIHGTSTTVTGILFINRSEVTNAVNGDTYLYDGYYFICSGSTGSTYDWTIVRAKGDKGDNSYVHIRYKNDDGAISPIWEAGYRWIGFATTNSAGGPEDVNEYTWSEFLGHDGPGQEFIYCLSDTLTEKMKKVHDIPSTGEGTDYERTGKKRFQDDEFLPGSAYCDSDDRPWTDNPQTVTREVNKQRQWVSTRTKNSSGVWGSFSTPSLWSEVGGSSYSIVLGNQNLKATYGGFGIPRPTLGSNSSQQWKEKEQDCLLDISNGDCSGTLVRYIKDSTQTATNFTISANSSDVSKIYIFKPNSEVEWVVRGGNDEILNHTLTGVSQFEIFPVCTDKNVSSWSVTLTSPDGVVKTITVTRTPFEPKISLGTTVYGYNLDENNVVSYSPSIDTVIDITYLSSGRAVEKSVFDSYGYKIRARYVDSSGDADQDWCENIDNIFTLRSIIGDREPSDGSLEFVVYTGEGNNIKQHYQETISIISTSGLADSIKTYLLDGNAAITGHLWAKDGKIGNWIINAEDDSGKITYGTDDQGNSIVIASYDPNYPTGSLRSANGSIVFDPGQTTEEVGEEGGTARDPRILLSGGSSIRIVDSSYSGYLKRYLTLDSEGLKTHWRSQVPHGEVRTGTSNCINIDGSGYLASGKISWGKNEETEDFDISIKGSIIATSGSIGGWEINGSILKGEDSYEDDSEASSHTITLDSSEENLGIYLETSWVQKASWTSDGMFIGGISGESSMSISPKFGIKIEAQSGDAVGEPVVEIDMVGNGHFGNAVSWNNGGSGWLANGNLSWDANGNIDIATEYNNGSPVGTHITSQGITITDPDISDSYVTTINRTNIKLKDSTENVISILDCAGLKFGVCGDDGDSISTNGEILDLCGGRDPYIEVEFPGSSFSKMNSTSITLSQGSGVSRKLNILQADDITLDGPVNATAFNTVSDETLKEKVSDIEISIEQIANAPAITYTWKGEDNKENVQAGTIAQYWEMVLPEVVIEGKNGTLGLNYQSLATVNTILLAKEVIALRKRIEELENKQ